MSSYVVSVVDGDGVGSVVANSHLNSTNKHSHTDTSSSSIYAIDDSNQLHDNHNQRKSRHKHRRSKSMKAERRQLLPQNEYNSDNHNVVSDSISSTGLSTRKLKLIIAVQSLLLI